jgi:N-acetylneuraminate lyase
MRQTTGLIAAVFTPFHADGALNLDMVPVLTDKLVADGLSGLFVCGTNGEGPNMTVAERMQVAEAFVAAAAGRLRVIVHVGHSSIAEARTLAAHAQACGADAFSSVSAFYFKPASSRIMAAAMAQIASAAPRLPFYYYHIPHLTGVAVDVDEFLTAAADIPNLAGVKYTAAAVHEFQHSLRRWKDRYAFFWGFDEMLLPALAVGAGTAVGSTYTFAAPLYAETMRAFRAGDLERARDLHAFCVEMIRVIVAHPPIPAQKAVMRMLGWDLGPCRLPLPDLGPEAFDTLQRNLDAIGFFRKVPLQQGMPVPL